MQVRVRGVHVGVDEELRSFVVLHLERALERIFQQQAVEVDVHLVDTNVAKGGLDLAARLTLLVPGAPSIHVEEVSDDMHKAVVGACDRLGRAARRWVDKRHHHPGEPALADLPVEEP
jgi:putative sigma-54 modulation protein